RLSSLANLFELREWMVENVKGLGYKEASHFLRNVGLGEEFAILDRHILRNVKRMEVIPEVPVSITKKRYLEIEEKLRRFSREIRIPLADLDLLFWSRETDWILKYLDELWERLASLRTRRKRSYLCSAGRESAASRI